MISVSIFVISKCFDFMENKNVQNKEAQQKLFQNFENHQRTQKGMIFFLDLQKYPVRLTVSLKGE
jgi:hypothetical protein